MDKVEYMGMKEELMNLIESLTEEEIHQAYQILKEKFTDTTTEEMEKWWADNMETKPHVELDLADAEIREIEEDEYIPWEQIKEKYDDTK